MEELKDLNQVFEKHAKNADAVGPNGSTCASESFNLVVASNGHKIRKPRLSHYFSGLPKEHWPDLYDWCKYCDWFISRKNQP